MIRKSYCSSYLCRCYSYLHKTIKRPILTSTLPLPLDPSPQETTPPDQNYHLTLCLSLADDLISKGRFSAARQVVSGIIISHTISAAVSAVDFATSRGLELNFGEVMRKLVDLGEFELAHYVYLSGVVDRGIELDSGIVNCLIIVLVQLGKFEEARGLFHGLIARGFIPCKDACEGVLLELCKQERLLEAFDCFVCIGRSKFQLGLRVCNCLINGLCSKGCMLEARKVFDILRERNGFLPTLYLFKSLFYGFCKKGMVAEAEMILQEMERCGFFVDKVMYTFLINVYCKDKNMDMAMRVYLRMLMTGCEPDNYTYNTLIHGFVRLGLFDKAWELCNKLNEAGQPDGVTYHFMMDKYCKDGKVDCAKALFSLMDRHNVAPEVYHYTTLMAALSKVSRLSEVDELYKRMLDCGVVPDHVLFFIFMKNIPKGRELELCLLMLQAIMKSGWPDLSMLSISTPLDAEQEIERLLGEIARRNLNLANVGYAIYTSALCEEGKTDSALASLQKMIDAGCSPLLFTFNSLIKRLCLDGLFEDAKSLIDIMQEQSMDPNSATCLVMVKEYCRRRDLKAAFDILKQMEERGLKPSLYIYDVIIGCLGREHRMFEAETLFLKMINSGVAPDETVYTTMINGYCRSGRAEEARLLFEMMIKNSIQPSSHSYTALISGLVKSNMTDKACMYLHRMLGDGIDPNIMLYTSLISYFLRKKEFEYALRLVDLVYASHIEPDPNFYIALVSGICRNITRVKKRPTELNKATERLFRLLQQRTCLSQENILRCSADSHRGMKCLALKLLEKIKEADFTPNLILYNAIILGFCWADRMQDAYDQFDLMQKEGIQPNQVTYTILIDAHGRNSEIAFALELFNKMNACGLTPDYITHQTLLKGLCMAGRDTDALCLLYAMHKRGFPPSKLSYQRLLHCFCTRCFSIPAFRVFEEMLQYGYFPRPYSVKWLLSVLCEEKNLHEARKLFQIMLENGKLLDELAKPLPVETYYEKRETDVTFDG